MSLDTYDNLKQEIIDWSHRDDLDLMIDTFIDLAEQEMYSNRIEQLRLRDGETLSAIATNTSDRFAALPTGFLEMRKLRIQIVNGSSTELEFRTPGQLNITSIVGMPLFFTVTDQIEFDRVSDQIYNGEIQFHAEFTALSTGNPTNAVLTQHPTIYLFGALWALKLHVEEIALADDYYNRFISAIRGANKRADWGRFGPSPAATVDGPTP